MIFGPDMEKPITSLGFNEIIADDDTAPKVILSSLEELNLMQLRNIKKLWPDQFQGILLQLQHLVIINCESMEGVVDTMGWLERDGGKLIELKLITLLRFSNQNLPCAGDNEHADGRRRWQRRQRRLQLERGRKAVKNSWKLQLRLINHWYSAGTPKRNPQTAASESEKRVGQRRPAGKRFLRF
ncbi:hypothetical protein CUMW_151160, partial [Citrus unshiu]